MAEDFSYPTPGKTVRSLREHLPHLGVLLERYEQDPKIQGYVQQNARVLRCVRGGLRMATENRVEFDPRRDYWLLPERRFAVAYLADNWTGYFLPSQSLRQYALHLLRHFDRAREDGIVTYEGVEYDAVGGQAALVEKLAAHARRMTTPEAWHALREIHPALPPDAGTHMAAFLETCLPGRKWEKAFGVRLPWFAYLGARSQEDMLLRQRFFYGYANLWTTTNAYRNAGAQSFATVLQNTPAGTCLDYALRWRNGESPQDTRFVTFSKTDGDQPRDRSDFTPVIEVYGFLNLHKGPFYNSLADAYWDWLGESSERGDPYELVRRVARRTQSWLIENPTAAERCTELFAEITNAPLSSRVTLESQRGISKRKQRTAADSDLLDAHLLSELTSHAAADCETLSPLERAAAALHLLLDAQMYQCSLPAEAPLAAKSPESTRSEGRSVLNAPPASTPAETNRSVRQLPPTLRQACEIALAYLHAGMHVLFAGPPGTGKTTLAQFVGYGWDHDFLTVPVEMPLEQAPITTVGNSAWSPFHTIGGIVPNDRGSYEVIPGLFVDPECAGSTTWRLRNAAIVLDEMNRADLDRCIGELYPLLSGSVLQVKPAGLPGVGAIAMSPRFRVIATVNDSSLDDIVFPISEGLARRFQRIELSGASREDVQAFLEGDELREEWKTRLDAATSAVDALFAAAHEKKLLSVEERLPVGAAYFGLLRAWITDQLTFGAEKTLIDEEQAEKFIIDALQPLRRKDERWAQVFDELSPE